MSDSECAGAGKCHGSMRWCDICGNGPHVCDTRLRGERCDSHPVPPSTGIIRLAKTEAERKIAEGERLLREGRAELEEAIAAERARWAYAEQIAQAEHALFGLAGHRR